MRKISTCFKNQMFKRNPAYRQPLFITRFRFLACTVACAVAVAEDLAKKLCFFFPASCKQWEYHSADCISGNNNKNEPEIIEGKCIFP